MPSKIHDQQVIFLSSNDGLVSDGWLTHYRNDNKRDCVMFFALTFTYHTYVREHMYVFMFVTL